MLSGYGSIKMFASIFPLHEFKIMVCCHIAITYGGWWSTVFFSVVMVNKNNFVPTKQQVALLHA